jgi:hypothetical protein
MMSQNPTHSSRADLKESGKGSLCLATSKALEQISYLLIGELSSLTAFLYLVSDIVCIRSFEQMMGVNATSIVTRMKGLWYRPSSTRQEKGDSVGSFCFITDNLLAIIPPSSDNRPTFMNPQRQSGFFPELFHGRAYNG